MTLSFSPEDTELREKYEANTTNRAEEFPQPDESLKSVTKKEVERRITHWETHWGNNTPLDIGQVLGWAEKQAQRQVDDANEARVAKGDKPLDPQECSEQVREISIKKAEGFLVGFWGERALGYYPVNMAKTVYAGAGAEANVFKDYLVVDANEAFSNLSKDAVIRAYYLTNLENNAQLYDETKKDFEERYKSLGLPFNEQIAHTVIQLHADVTGDKQSWQDEWSKDPRNRNAKLKPSETELIKWVMENRYTSVNRGEKGKPSPEWAFALKWSEYLINNENTLVFKDTNERETVKEAAQMEVRLDAALAIPVESEEQQAAKNRAVKKAINPDLRYSKSMYFDVTVPDALLQNKKTHQNEGIVEIKSYTPQEFKAMVTALEYHFDHEDYDEFPYGVDGLKVGVVVEPKGDTTDQIMQLGFNPMHEFEFIGMVQQKTQESLDGIDKNEYPMIVRVLDDIEDEDIVRFGDVMQRYGYHNFIIQKVGFSRKEIEQLAKETTIRNARKIVQVKGPQHSALLQDLSNEENWPTEANEQ